MSTNQSTTTFSFKQILRIVDLYQREIDPAVRRQLDEVLAGEDALDKSPNAMRAVRYFVSRLHSGGYISDGEAEDVLFVIGDGDE